MLLSKLKLMKLPALHLNQKVLTQKLVLEKVLDGRKKGSLKMKLKKQKGLALKEIVFAQNVDIKQNIKEELPAQQLNVLNVGRV